MYYRRSDAAGGAFFFTVNLADRSSRLLVNHINILRDSVRDVQRAHPFRIVAMVALPDHLHAIWSLPPGDKDYPLRWSLFKATFSRQLNKVEPVSDARRRKRERGIWQRRYWEHQLRDDADLASHVDYIHINPVKHRHVSAAMDWPYSSIHRFIRQGMLPADWAIDTGGPDTGFGE
jgi:putative transposase